MHYRQFMKSIKKCEVILILTDFYLETTNTRSLDIFISLSYIHPSNSYLEIFHVYKVILQDVPEHLEYVH